MKTPVGYDADRQKLRPQIGNLCTRAAKGYGLRRNANTIIKFATAQNV